MAAKSLAERGYHRVYLFESAAEVGGNAHTLPLQLGPDVRWADLGVNDYNTKTYHNIYRLICELGVQSVPLDDTISYAKPDGSVSYTLDGANGTAYPYPEMRHPDGTPTAAWTKFLADQQYFWQSVYVIATDETYTGRSVQQYLDNPTLPGQPAYQYGPDFVNNFLLPRINGMYFANPQGPFQMPIQLIMHYYVLQEGYNQYGTAPNPDRRYFVNGTRQFQDRLQSWLQYDYEQNVSATDQAADAALGLYRFNYNVAASVLQANDGTFSVLDVSQENSWNGFARVVVATPAPAALAVLAQLPQAPGSPAAAVMQNLAEYQYAQSTAYVHTDARQLPRDAEAWRSFNINIFDYTGTPSPGEPTGFPYTITYLENRHQNDALNLQYRPNPYQGPFFTTLNPRTPIPDRFVLRQPGQPDNLLKYTFSHCVPDLDTAQRQLDLANLQTANALNGIFLAGHYTHGVGLHEECWISGNEAARRVVGEDLAPDVQLHGDAAKMLAKGAARSGPATHAPHYLRAALRAR